MTSKRARGLGLALATTLWCSLTGWVLLAAAGPVAPGRPAVRRSDSGADQEPPPPRSVWDRVTAGVHALFRQPGNDPSREAVRDALEPLGANAWHRAGLRGKGIKIAVLDSGFRGYQNALGKVMPATVKARSFRKDGRLEARDSQHGILCAEVVHHLAPEAELLLANWEPETPAAFLEAVRWARAEGAQVITCSVIMPSWSDGEGGGAVHHALRKALGDGLMFASAGNTAQRHWTGQAVPASDGLHQWVKGKKDNVIRPYAQDRVSVELTSCDGAFELIVLDTARGKEVGRAHTLANDGCSTAVVRFEPQPSRRYSIRLKATVVKGKPAPPQFHLTCLGGKLQYATAPGSIPFPSDGDEVVAVGAVDGKGRRLSYSSCGPCGRSPKPDLSAVVPFPSIWRPEQAFAGTSAAAPQAAGLAALLWSQHPEWSASQVREKLGQSAAKVKQTHCAETGHGVVRLPKLAR